MAVIQFPSNPTNGQQYVVGNITYTYDTVKQYWRVARTTLSQETLNVLRNTNLYKLYLAGR